LAFIEYFNRTLAKPFEWKYEGYHAEVTKSINSYVGWLIPVLVFAAIAFMLEGYFIGLTEGQTLRNSALAAFGIGFAPTAFVAWSSHSNHVLWLALSLYMVISVVTLGVRLQRLSISTPPQERDTEIMGA
jgi:MATE family multidrug resistance protein